MKVRFNKDFRMSERDNKHKSSFLFWKISKLTTRLKASNILVMSIALLVGACSTPTGMSFQKSSRLTEHNVPNKWQENIASTENDIIATNWVKSFKDNDLDEIISYALQSNYALDADKIGVALAKERLNISAIFISG